MKFSLRLTIAVCLLVSISFIAHAGRLPTSFDASKVNKSQIQKIIKTPTPLKPLVENITFAINKDFADEHTDWKQRADKVIEDVNVVYAKNTQKRFKIAKYITYDAYKYGSPNASIDKLIWPSDTGNYYNATAANPCDTGMLLIYFVGDENVNLGSSTGGSNYSPETGNILGFAVIREPKTNSTLLKESMPFGDDLETTYWSRLKTTIHEMGHSLGLASPEWYSYDYVDLTGAFPSLPSYDLNEMYPLDPMTAAGGTPIHYPDKLWEFSDLNAFIINHSLCRPLTLGQMDMAKANQIVVRVKDENGKAVQNAKIDVFGINHFFKRYGDENPNYFVFKQSVFTNKKGTAMIKNPQKLSEMPPMGAVFYSEMVKVSKNGKYGGDYVTIQELQRTRWLKNSAIYYLDIVIK